VFDSNFQLVTDLGAGAFVDPKIPQKFAPYGIQTVTANDGSETFGSPILPSIKRRAALWTPSLPGASCCLHFALNRPSPFAVGRRDGAGRLWAHEQRAPDYE